MQHTVTGVMNKLHSSQAACYLQTAQRRLRVGGRQHNASAAVSLWWPDSGAPCSSSMNPPRRVVCERLGQQRSQHDLPLGFSKHSDVVGRSGAIAADLML